MLIDCEGCPVRHIACDDCIVTALTTLSVGVPSAVPVTPSPDHATRLDPAERRVVDLFVRAGLVGAEYAATLRAVRTPTRVHGQSHSRAADAAVAAGW